jgi:uncharacterized protein involved in exopolysaccharide biosynthesis
MTPPSISSRDTGDLIGQFSLRDFLTILFKRRWLVALVAISVPTAVLVVSLLLPRTYEVSAMLVVNRARAEMPMAPTESGRLVVNQLSEQDLNSEIEVLKSREMIEGVLLNLGDFETSKPERSGLRKMVGSAKQMLGGNELTVFDGLVVDLQENIGITAIRRSNAIKVSYRSSDPEWATRVVKTLTAQYLERRADRFQSPQAVSFFKEQMNEAEKRLVEGEVALEQYVDGASITMVGGPTGTDSLAAQKGLVMERLSSLESVLGDASVEYQSQLQEVSSLREQLPKEPERLASSNRMNQGAATEEIERALAALRLERDALLQDFKPDSRHVRDIDTQIEMAEERLEHPEENINVDGTEPNPVHLQLKGDLLRAETELNGTLARIAPLQAQVLQYREELNELNEKGFGLDGLRRRIRVAEEDYLLYRKKHEEARASAAMDQEKFVNVTVAQPARMPLRPVPRDLFKRFLAAMVAGVLGGFGIVFSLEQFLFRSFTTGDEIERKLGIPHISSIPDSSQAG